MTLCAYNNNTQPLVYCHSTYCSETTLNSDITRTMMVIIVFIVMLSSGDRGVMTNEVLEVWYHYPEQFSSCHKANISTICSFHVFPSVLTIRVSETEQRRLESAPYCDSSKILNINHENSVVL